MYLHERGIIQGSDMCYCSGDTAIISVVQVVWEWTSIRRIVQHDGDPIVE